MKINIRGNMHQYQFEGTSDQLGLNIYVYIVDQNAVMIDSGHEEEFLQVKKDLDEKGITIKHLILTHFHPDHTGGIKHLRDIEIIGSYKAEETLSLFYDDYEQLLPNRVIKEETVIELLGKEFTLIPNPSHSECSMVIKVDKLCTAGDDVMFLDDESQVIPYCATSVETHLEGVQKLRWIAEGNLILPSHGRMNKCTLYFKFQILYFKHILKNPNSSYEEFEKLYQIPFKKTEWHKLNCSKVDGYING